MERKLKMTESKMVQLMIDFAEFEKQMIQDYIKHREGKSVKLKDILSLYQDYILSGQVKFYDKVELQILKN